MVKSVRKNEFEVNFESISVFSWIKRVKFIYYWHQYIIGDNMHSFVSKVTKAGQITIPKEVRKNLKLTDKDYVTIEELGSVLLIKKTGSGIQDIEKYFETLAEENKITPKKIMTAIKELRHS